MSRVTSGPPADCAAGVPAWVAVRAGVDACRGTSTLPLLSIASVTPGNLPIVLPSRVRKIRVKLSSSRVFSSSYTTTTLPSLLVFVFGLGGVAARAGVPAVCGFAGSACKVIVAPATGLPSCVIVTSDSRTTACAVVDSKSMPKAAAITDNLRICAPCPFGLYPH